MTWEWEHRSRGGQWMLTFGVWHAVVQRLASPRARWQATLTRKTAPHEQFTSPPFPEAVLDTHIHADHLSRSRQLAELAGATFYLPTQQRVAFPFTGLHDSDVVSIGTAQLVALHTPGHTLESTCYLLNSRVLFTGDTLFLAAVGRPDLEANPDKAHKRAQLLYESLQRLLTLAPDTLVLPGHTSTPPAFDGRPLLSSLGEVRATISRLQLPAAAFVAEILARIPPTPPNHKQIIAINQDRSGVPADAATVEAGANRCAVA
jgi:hypothetical protein